MRHRKPLVQRYLLHCEPSIGSLDFHRAQQLLRKEKTGLRVPHKCGNHDPGEAPAPSGKALYQLRQMPKVGIQPLPGISGPGGWLDR